MLAHAAYPIATVTKVACTAGAIGANGATPVADVCVLTQESGVFVTDSERPKTLLLDAYGVLIGEPTKPLFDAVSRTCQCTATEVEAIFREQFRDALWRGRISTSEFWRDLALACGLPSPRTSWLDTMLLSMVPLPATRLLPRWRRRARLVVISNHRHEWLVPVLQRHNLDRVIDAMYVSSVTGKVKPSLDVYTTSLGGDLTSCVGYVDDKSANVQAAEALGIRSCVADAHGAWISEVEDWLWP